MKIPEDYIEFLYWVKEQTEAYWSELDCEEWIHGAKWLGLEESAIDDIEQEFGVKFTWHHKQFLKILHTIDRKEVRIVDADGWTVETPDENSIRKEYPFFYNWNTDKEEIQKYLKWPYETILEDVLGTNGVWLKSWGSTRPSSDEAKEKMFAQWFEKAPPLIPINSHRFVVSQDLTTDNPVLSVYGSDTIVYGWHMKHYLLQELGALCLGLANKVYDEEYDETYYEPNDEFEAINREAFATAKNKDIPVLKEMMLYWSSGWSSFGLEYPNKKKGGAQPIVKTYVPEGETNEEIPKRFTPFGLKDN